MLIASRSFVVQRSAAGRRRARLAILTRVRYLRLLVVLSVSAMQLAMSGCAPRTPLSDLSIEPALITPNGDGQTDLTRIAYRLGADSTVSIYLTDTTGARREVRRAVARPSRPVPYELLFNGIDADGRMIPDGDYMLTVETDAASLSQPLRIRDADTRPPRITEFTVRSGGDGGAITFTPNRDAIDDHVYINVTLDKPARLSVYVQDANGFRQDVPRELLGQNDFNNEYLQAGRYYFDYDGGIDKGADPPPDGSYVLVAEAEDRIGQRDVHTKTLIIRDSGRPQAEIVTQADGQGVIWGGVGRTPELTVKLNDRMFFTATVRNVGAGPIRTTGPFDPNDCYTLGQNRYSKNFPEADGAWRFGVDFESNGGEDHPFRWGVGSIEDLKVIDHNGGVLYYLEPGKQVVVRGCIIFDRVPVRNPFRMWGALIHERVEVFNRNVSPILVTVVEP
jgi:hypothetical protein